MPNIPYTVCIGSARVAMVSMTPCPHGLLTRTYDIHIHVGGQACMRCDYFIRKNMTTHEVTCGHK